MKVVYINSAKSEVSEIDIVPSPDELARLCGSHPSKVATLPSGDILLAGVGDASRAGFSIGGSAPIRSSGIVIGKRDTWRGLTPARSTDPAWKSKPSFYLVATQDGMIPPPAQRMMAERAGATVREETGSHAIYVSKPQPVADIIEAAAG
jgi:pimeloyl-ACP methyl ester carboxylesterase